MRRAPLLISLCCICVGGTLGLMWVASRPTPLPHRFLDDAEILQREGWAESGTRFKDNGTYRLNQPMSATEAAVAAEVGASGWKVERKPKSITFSKPDAYITLQDRGPRTTVHIQSYRPVTRWDRLRQWWRRLTRRP